MTYPYSDYPPHYDYPPVCNHCERIELENDTDELCQICRDRQCSRCGKVTEYDYIHDVKENRVCGDCMTEEEVMEFLE